MAENIFKRVFDKLNQPLPPILPPARSKKDAKAAPAGKTTTGTTTTTTPPAPSKTMTQKTNTAGQVKAVDLTAEMRRRQAAIAKARAQAENEAMKKKLEAQQEELTRLRREYEQAMAAEAQTHAATDEWTHTVVKGDTLWGIAKRYYGNGARWPEIHAANKDKVPNPSLIYPGQVLVIPDKD